MSLTFPSVTPANLSSFVPSITRSSPEAALDRLTTGVRPPEIGFAQWSSMTTSEQAKATAPAGEPVQLARVDVLPNGTVAIRPEDRLRADLPDVTLPNNQVGAAGFSPGFWTHDYLVTAIAPSLRGTEGLAAVGRALGH